MSGILVVDDEAIITLQLEETLRMMGYTVAGMAVSGEDAIEKTRRLVPDLVLMDIVMPGRLNGIDAAKTITGELEIPVIFVTSYADDTIIARAKEVRPYGYIVKPFNDLELKAAIEVALFRRANELEQKKKAPAAGSSSPGSEDAVPEYLPLPEIRTVLLRDIFSGIIIFLYVDPVVRDPIFKFALEAGIQKGGRQFFAYYQSTLQKHFLEEIRKGILHTRRIKKGELFFLPRLLERCTSSLPAGSEGSTLNVLFDFSNPYEFDEIVKVKNIILTKIGEGVPITGILAVSMADLDHKQILLLTEGFARVIVSTGKDTALSFSQTSFVPESVAVVPQSTIEDVVKKLLEPVILSTLKKPISGFDIVHEIHNRYKVLIPQARIYTFLYGLEEKGYLEMKISGKSKMYSPTKAGNTYIRQRMAEYRLVFKHILGEDPDMPGAARDTPTGP